MRKIWFHLRILLPSPTSYPSSPDFLSPNLPCYPLPCVMASTVLYPPETIIGGGNSYPSKIINRSLCLYTRLYCTHSVIHYTQKQNMWKCPPPTPCTMLFCENSVSVLVDDV